MVMLENIESFIVLSRFPSGLLCRVGMYMLGVYKFAFISK